MKWIIYCLLAVLPTESINAQNIYHRLNGVWTDHHRSLSIEIKSVSNGIRVRQKKGFWKKKWRTYYYMGKDIYDDCRGNYIHVYHQNKLTWKRSGKRPIVLRRSYSWDYEDYYPDQKYLWKRDVHREDYLGYWYCSDYNLYLEIQPAEDGLRARRRNGSWVYYTRNHRDNSYRDHRGNRYYFEGHELIWTSGDKRRALRFKTR